MHQINLAAVDLNLLVVFDALMAERNVTRAAARIGLTQPATSHALSRLRALFDDPLFVRAPKGMVPTSRATEVSGSIRSALARIEIALAPERAFDPAGSQRTFTIGLSDYAAFVLLPGLMERMGRYAPNVRIVARNTSHTRGLSMIDLDEVELIAGNFPEAPAHMSEDLLFQEDFVTAARQDHPDLVDGLDVDAYLKLPHLHVSLKGEPRGYLDDVIQSQGLHRNVTVTVGHFLIAPFMLRATDAIATEPRRILEPLAKLLHLRLIRPPLPIPPFPVTQIWHRRYDADPGHAWLRSMVREIGSAM